jgi:hypothetical protein
VGTREFLEQRQAVAIAKAQPRGRVVQHRHRIARSQPACAIEPAPRVLLIAGSDGKLGAFPGPIGGCDVRAGSGRR